MSETAEVIGTEEDRAAAGSAGPEDETVAPAETSEDSGAESSGESAEASGSADSAADGDDADGEDEADGDDLLVQEGDIAGDYLERLLDLLDYDGDIDLDVEAGRAIVSIDGGDDLEKLVGPRGNVLEALQELTRLAVQQETGSRSRLMLDIAGWRAGRREELRRIGRTAAENVAKTGEKEKLQPMSPFERKVVHDAVAEVDGVTSESEGEEPKRRVVVVPE
ncbi:single-stranded DNA-binding protein [Saccharomonospora sp. CUA-673]|uniref:Jag family protein n=1 Tax=Saccharomonospora sp. CUA-673 TaxID=1904969 RepID=UPI000968F15D|nr:R3H domain-containing nucleic acid-binding protein [Saccharomonospora sp. CUA-673]OLT40655.1 single-stranded DNA-binding protein [Saccharomonospora sp. CUA-673]